MDRNGSNKNHRQHVIYTPFYDALFGGFEVKNLLEFGIGSMNPNFAYSMHGQPTIPSGSLRGWKEAFPQAQIFGVDIDEDVIFTEDRITTLKSDVISRESLKQLNKDLSMLLQNEQFQVIVDDAVHEFEANKMCFEETIDLLDVRGFYIIEDILQTTSNLETFKNWAGQLELDNILIEIPNDTNSTCSCMLVIRK